MRRGSRRSRPWRPDRREERDARLGPARCATSCTATGSMIGGRDAVHEAGRAQRALDRRRPAPRRGRAPRRCVERGQRRSAPARRARRSCRASRSPPTATVRLIVSPVTSAEQKIVVPSISPATISARAAGAARQRCAGPSRSRMRWRSASTATTREHEAERERQAEREPVASGSRTARCMRRRSRAGTPLVDDDDAVDASG